MCHFHHSIGQNVKNNSFKRFDSLISNMFQQIKILGNKSMPEVTICKRCFSLEGSELSGTLKLISRIPLQKQSHSWSCVSVLRKTFSLMLGCCTPAESLRFFIERQTYWFYILCFLEGVAFLIFKVTRAGKQKVWGGGRVEIHSPATILNRPPAVYNLHHSIL